MLLPVTCAAGSQELAGGFCSYEAIEPDGKVVTATVEKPDILFMTDDWMIVHHNSERRMIATTKQDDGKLDCTFEYGVTCRAPFGETAFQGLPELADFSRCTPASCNADPVPPLGMTKSIIAGGLMFYGGNGSPRVVDVGVSEFGFPRWYGAMVSGLKFDAVDHDPNIISAIPCYDDSVSPNVCVSVSSHREFLQARKDGTIDILLLDPADDGMKVPLCERSVEFFKLVRAKMSDVGVVVWDVWPQDSPVAHLRAMVKGLNLQENQLVLTYPDSGHIVAFARLAPVPEAKSASRPRKIKIDDEDVWVRTLSEADVAIRPDVGVGAEALQHLEEWRTQMFDDKLYVPLHDTQFWQGDADNDDASCSPPQYHEGQEDAMDRCTTTTTTTVAKPPPPRAQTRAERARIIVQASVDVHVTTGGGGSIGSDCDGIR